MFALLFPNTILYKKNQNLQFEFVPNPPNKLVFVWGLSTLNKDVVLPWRLIGLPNKELVVCPFIILNILEHKSFYL